uniref:C-type lectin domain-containing protein n=1 Tax=Bos mutus grunniens TaxID=30521 RepID=A0A8B9YEX4_BOSMU
MKNQKESYSEPSLVKDTRRQQMRDSPSAREKLIVVILGIVCFVLMYTIVRLITFIPSPVIQEQNYSSLITRLQKECHCGHCPKDCLISCATKNSTLLYIDNEEEMKFLMSLSIILWIQVSREGHGRPWKWLNGSTCKLQITDNIPGEHNCAVQSLWGIKAEDCHFPNTYHCKHKLEN